MTAVHLEPSAKPSAEFPYLTTDWDAVVATIVAACGNDSDTKGWLAKAVRVGAVGHGREFVCNRLAALVERA